MLHKVASYLCLLPELPEGQDTTIEKEVLLELLVSALLGLLGYVCEHISVFFCFILFVLMTCFLKFKK